MHYSTMTINFTRGQDLLTGKNNLSDTFRVAKWSYASSRTLDAITNYERNDVLDLPGNWTKKITKYSFKLETDLRESEKEIKRQSALNAEKIFKNVKDGSIVAAKRTAIRQDGFKGVSTELYYSSKNGFLYQTDDSSLALWRAPGNAEYALSSDNPIFII